MDFTLLHLHVVLSGCSRLISWTNNLYNGLAIILYKYRVLKDVYYNMYYMYYNARRYWVATFFNQPLVVPFLHYSIKLIGF